MKKYLLPESGKFYKANLHCHTNISDGRCTPEEIKELYKAQGYSVVAYTDHDLMIPHHDLSDEDFIAMTGYEMEINEPNKEWPKLKTCHICFVALSPEIDKQVCWNRETLGYTFPQSHELAKKYAKFDENEPDFVREYSKECISTMMKKGRDAGFFVTYNHPTWSNQNQSDYSGYENMHAMEIVNYGCQAMGYDEYNPHVYDDMLNLGKKIYCIAADDNHNKWGQDSFGGFTMIKADKLDYKLIGEALLKGNFYASERPLIHALYIEGDMVHIECSPAVKITINSDVIHADAAYPENGETTLTHAAFKLWDCISRFRLTVTDEHGKHACTNAYYIDELDL